MHYTNVSYAYAYLRSISKAIQPFGEEVMSHVRVWKRVQRFNPRQTSLPLLKRYL
jgi:hypothetical protein